MQNIHCADTDIHALADLLRQVVVLHKCYFVPWTNCSFHVYLLIHHKTFIYDEISFILFLSQIWTFNTRAGNSFNYIKIRCIICEWEIRVYKSHYPVSESRSKSWLGISTMGNQVSIGGRDQNKKKKKKTYRNWKRRKKEWYILSPILYDLSYNFRSQQISSCCGAKVRSKSL